MLRNKKISSSVLRFCGDSGDGVQLIGNKFTDSVAIFGNDISTLPDFPAEIRAPAGTLDGVSGFQINFSSKKIFTHGDRLDMLIAMNPAALKKNIVDLKEAGILIVNKDNFTSKNLLKANYQSNPLESEEFKYNYRIYEVPVAKMIHECLKEVDLKVQEKLKCQNFFVFGIILWLYDKDISATVEWIKNKFENNTLIMQANIKALKSGYNYSDIMEIFPHKYQIDKTPLEKGIYRKLTGNEALAYGLITAANKAKLNLLYSGYPITPASDILHYLSRNVDFGIKTVQAEDEIAAVGIALGASYSGGLGVTASSGPGIVLKNEFIGLAISVELPLLIINVQRGGPSTGLPTKIEQADLLLAMYGRNGESPIPILACNSPSNCFDVAYQAIKIAIKYMTPVMILSDAYLANGSEIWKVPNVDDLDEIECELYQKQDQEFTLYSRKKETLARKWVKVGTPGLEHVLTGLEKDINGNISYDADNHQKMCELRRDKITKIQDSIEDVKLYGKKNGSLLVISWGSTHGTAYTSIKYLQENGYDISYLNLQNLNPLPKNLKEIISNFKKIVVLELNLGQLVVILRNNFNRDFIQLNQIKGKSFSENELISNLKRHYGK